MLRTADVHSDGHFFRGRAGGEGGDGQKGGQDATEHEDVALSGSVVLDLPWHAMSRTLETKDFILFFDARGKVYHMPKRGLRERDHREVLRLIAARSP